MKLNILIFLITNVLYGQESLDFNVFKEIGNKIINEGINYESKIKISSIKLRTNFETGEKMLDTNGFFSDIEKKILRNISKDKLINILDAQNISFSDDQKTFYILDTINFFMGNHKICKGTRSFEVIRENRKQNDYYILYDYSFKSDGLIVSLNKMKGKSEKLINFYFKSSLDSTGIDLINMKVINLSNMKKHFNK